MFTTALFTIAKRWKQPKCPSTDEWINKTWSIHTMENYSFIKRNEALTCYNMDGPWKHYAKGKPPDTKDHIL